jgi:hypothetical protein
MDKISADDMMRHEVVRKLRERYAAIHPTIFLSSLAKATSLADLFDMLDTVPSDFPIRWNATDRRWATNDLLPL